MGGHEFTTFTLKTFHVVPSSGQQLPPAAWTSVDESAECEPNSNVARQVKSFLFV